MLEFPNLTRVQIAKVLESLSNPKSCRRCKHLRDGTGCPVDTYRQCRSGDPKHKRLFEER